MAEKVEHILTHFDLGTFPEKEQSAGRFGCRFSNDDLVIFYEDYSISLGQIMRIIHSKNNNKVTFNDLKKGW